MYPHLGQTHFAQEVAQLVRLLVGNGFVEDERDAFEGHGLRADRNAPFPATVIDATHVYDFVFCEHAGNSSTGPALLAAIRVCAVDSFSLVTKVFVPCFPPLEVCEDQCKEEGGSNALEETQ